MTASQSTSNPQPVGGNGSYDDGDDMRSLTMDGNGSYDDGDDMRSLTMDGVERAKVIDRLVREHRSEVYEALYRLADEEGRTIHEDIITAWKANHLEEVQPIADGGLRPSMVPLYRIVEFR